jgi:hypothetical protein
MSEYLHIYSSFVRHIVLVNNYLRSKFDDSSDCVIPRHYPHMNLQLVKDNKKTSHAKV